MLPNIYKEKRDFIMKKVIALALVAICTLSMPVSATATNKLQGDLFYGQVVLCRR